MNGSLEFAAGETSKEIIVPIDPDSLAEPDELFCVQLSNAVGADITNSVGVATIINDDFAISINDFSKSEGKSGSTAFAFTVSLSAALANPVTVYYSTADGTAFAGSDYTAISNTELTFAPGETSKTIVVFVNGDATPEPNETFTVKLTNASGASIADSQGVGTILNDDKGKTSSLSAYSSRKTAGMARADMLHALAVDHFLRSHQSPTNDTSRDPALADIVLLDLGSP